MREQLIQYVELLFAGGRDYEDIKQEILQNTLDRYDDLIAEGKVPEAAYRLAITGIGDINEILGTKAPAALEKTNIVQPAVTLADNDTPTKKILRAIGVALYIICAIPVIILSEFGMDVIGVCGTLAIVAVATVLMILGSRKTRQDIEKERAEEEAEANKSPLAKSISGLIWAIGIAAYFLVSFRTGAWHITWVIFPILGALDKLQTTLVQNREAMNSDVNFPSKTKLRKSIESIIWAVGLAVYFIISFATGAWYITWLVFPITGAVQGLVIAILDYKEAVKNEA